MIDFVTGLLIAIKETFKAKKTINYPFEKGSLGTRSRGEHEDENISKVLSNHGHYYHHHHLHHLHHHRRCHHSYPCHHYHYHLCGRLQLIFFNYFFQLLSRYLKQ